MAKRIVVGVDNSETALRAAQKAAEMAVGLSAQLHVISAFRSTVMENIRSTQSAQSTGHQSQAYQRMMEQVEQQAHSIAGLVAETLTEEFPDLEVSHRAVEGSPANTLVREAANVDAEFIVVGNKRVQGFSRVLGSIARSVASEAHCDVYIVNTTRA